MSDKLKDLENLLIEGEEIKKEKIAAQQKTWREENKEKMANYEKAYREANKEKKKAYYEQKSRELGFKSYA